MAVRYEILLTCACADARVFSKESVKEGFVRDLASLVNHIAARRPLQSRGLQRLHQQNRALQGEPSRQVLVTPSLSCQRQSWEHCSSQSPMCAEVSFLTYGNAIFILIFLRTVVPRLLVSLDWQNGKKCFCSICGHTWFPPPPPPALLPRWRFGVQGPRVEG